MKNFALLSCLLLAACASDGNQIPPAAKAPPKRPVLDSYLSHPCNVPGISAGQDARAALFEARAALKSCSAKKDVVVRLYGETR